MAQLDRFLAALVSHRASALMLVTDAPAQLDMQGTPRAITKAPLTEPQLLALLQELAPGNARIALDAGAAVTFGYKSDDGAFSVQVAERNGGLRAVVRAEGAAPAPAADEPAAAPASAPQRASAPVAAVVAIRSEIDTAQKVSRITVSDNGPGIPAASRERVFQPFFTSKRNGTGLGLALVQKIIVFHNGRVVAGASSEGGATLQVTLPLA